MTSRVVVSTLACTEYRSNQGEPASSLNSFLRLGVVGVVAASVLVGREYMYVHSCPARKRPYTIPSKLVTSLRQCYIVRDDGRGTKIPGDYGPARILSRRPVPPPVSLVHLGTIFLAVKS